MHIGPVHMNYVFSGRIPEVQASIARVYSGLRVEFQGDGVRIENCQAKLRCLQPGELYYLDIPFYFPLQAKN